MISLILIFEMLTSHKYAIAYIDFYFFVFLLIEIIRYLGSKCELRSVNKVLANYVNWCSCKVQISFQMNITKGLKLLCEVNI